MNRSLTVRFSSLQINKVRDNRARLGNDVVAPGRHQTRLLRLLVRLGRSDIHAERPAFPQTKTQPQFPAGWELSTHHGGCDVRVRGEIRIFRKVRGKVLWLLVRLGRGVLPADREGSRLYSSHTDIYS